MRRLMVLLVAALAASTTSTSLGASEVPPPAAGAVHNVDRQIHFREEFGFDATLDHVERVNRSYAGRADLRAYGPLLSPSEFADFEGRLSRVPLVAQLDSELRDEKGAGYGGIYTDQKRGGAVVVLFTEAPTLHDTQAISGSGLDDVLSVRIVEHTLGELAETQAIVHLATDEFVRRGVQLLGTAQLIDANKVRIAVGTGQATAARELLALAVDVEVNAYEIVEVNADDFKLESAPIGGDGLDFDGPECSVGFSARNGFGNFVLTAGHCVNEPLIHMDPWFHWHGLPYVTEAYVNGGSTDSQVHLPNGPASGLVWDNGGGQRRVTSTSTIGGFYDNVGDPACVAGRFNRWCGTITALWVATTFDGITIYNGRCTSYISQGGDSGGAVWGPQLDGTAAALGIHRGNSGAMCPGPVPKVYTHIGFALNALGLWGVIYG